MKKSKTVNAGGINGLGESLINVNSDSFKQLKSMIRSHSQNLGKHEVIENNLLSVRFQMESYLSNDNAEYIPSGAFIEKFLKAVNVTKKRFAEYLNYDYPNLIAILKGRRKINPDLAIKLGQIFKVNPVIWLHLESKNELQVHLSQNKELTGTSYNLLELLR